MSLVSDANPGIGVPASIVKKSINLDVLEKIENDLDIEDIVSILFLMVCDYKNAFSKIYQLYRKAKKDGTCVISEIVKDNEENWEDKFLESICVCNNRKVIKKLGLCLKDLETRYLPKNRFFKQTLNPIAKCLYVLCESLTTEETKMLLRLVKEDKVKYEPTLDDVDQLELHLLYWMNIEYISILSEKRGNLKNLLKHLKTFDDIELITVDLAKYDEQHHSYSSSTDTSEKTTFSIQNFNKSNLIEIENNDKSIRQIKKGLCVIINEMYFHGSQYETRYGTNADSDKLSKTFKGFGFAVHIFENLKKNEMLSKIRNLSKLFGSDYDCIFVCILSHGYKGGIITSDEAEVSIESIENAFCCSEFTEIIKIVIIQACQGKAVGKVAVNENSLVTDGLDDLVPADITARKNFCIFMSTLQGYVSMRDKLRGSWFIQEFCDILQQKERKVTFFNSVLKVMQVVQNKRGIMRDELVSQLPELRMLRLDTDFELPQYTGH
ncbi:PREDICTED: caspase-8 [Polistes dominula]|uniref:Caspase-8 n=1 Tax=Polistes dominula TaxID=743375 RepID=A0ABM1IRM4_POLDO|nr:PREDICTED: caspase-8 [Polistes dominula]